ncbi:MAG: hypothetical protein ACJAWT_000739 [Glaciecola sp.]|jgi:hypothetical protein
MNTAFEAKLLVIDSLFEYVLMLCIVNHQSVVEFIPNQFFCASTTALD